jgi:tetratricopeptide (TPR) repeat protein
VSRWVLLVALLAGCASADPYALAFERAELAFAMGDADDARDAYQAALALRPDDPSALHGLARCHATGGRAEAALEVYALLEQVSPGSLAGDASRDYDDALQGAAAERLSRGDPASALRYLRRLQQRDPSHPALRDLLPAALIAEGGRLQVVGRGDRAEALFQEALGRDPLSPDPALALGEALVEQGRLDTAISVLSDALLRHPGDGRLRALMDRVLGIRYPDPIRPR